MGGFPAAPGRPDPQNRRSPAGQHIKNPASLLSLTGILDPRLLYCVVRKGRVERLPRGTGGVLWGGPPPNTAFQSGAMRFFLGGGSPNRGWLRGAGSLLGHPGLLLREVLTDRKSSILGIQAAPGGRNTLQKDDGLSTPPSFGKVSRQPGAAQTPKNVSRSAARFSRFPALGPGSFKRTPGSFQKDPGSVKKNPGLLKGPGVL